ncbi:MAG: peroxidase-related enzyme [Gammaproteobacteria bacterium]|nr:peroxidase-related enzyme [Gammaproteobacteria bacterium]
MSWIKEIDTDEASGELAEIYEQLIASRGKLSNIMQVHSLNPRAMQKHLELYMHLLFGKSKLSRGEREGIAVVVSATNNCAYCVSHHAEALARYENDEAGINQLIAGLRYLDGDDRNARIMRYASKLTATPSAVSEKDIQQLRQVGLGDDEILDVNLVTAYFNFVNRIALGLGVEFSADEVSGYDA